MSRRGAIRLLLFGGVAAFATACGVKGPLVPPPSETEGSGRFPRRYPQEERPVERGSGSKPEDSTGGGPVTGDEEDPPKYTNE